MVELCLLVELLLQKVSKPFLYIHPFLISCIGRSTSPERVHDSAIVSALLLSFAYAGFDEHR